MRNVILAGTLALIVGCANAPPEPDILQRSISSPAESPAGASEIDEREARTVAPIQPLISGSVISWRHPKSGMRIKLFLGDVKPDPQDGNHSRIEVTSGDSPVSRLVFPSLVTKALYASRGSNVIPRVLFSVSGRTALFEEDISDASPVYNNVLFAIDSNSGQVTARVLDLPRKPVLPYGLAAAVLSITDDEATMAFFPDRFYFKMTFDRIESAERHVN